ncbi:MAG: hypothetical protein MUO99_05080 [Dehalococcoidales bacterium]|nr:hypothetical protein [Dehalococcoidales bacterium]
MRCQNCGFDNSPGARFGASCGAPLIETPEPKKTATGLEENVAGLLCYVGWWVSGIVFLLLEPENKFIRFHAIQSIIVFGIITVAASILSWIPFIHFIGWIIWLIGVALWIVLMVKAYQGAKFKIIWAGNVAEKSAEGQQPPKQP